MSYEIRTLKVEAKPTATIRLDVPHARLGAVFGEVLPEIFTWVGKQGYGAVFPPFGIFHGMSDGLWDLEAGVAVEKAFTEGEGRIKPSSTPDGEAAFTIHVGPYDKLGDAHDALRAWCAENDRKTTGIAWEYYVNDPGELPPEEWKTEVYLQLTGRL